MLLIIIILTNIAYIVHVSPNWVQISLNKPDYWTCQRVERKQKHLKKIRNVRLLVYKLSLFRTFGLAEIFTPGAFPDAALYFTGLGTGTGTPGLGPSCGYTPFIVQQRPFCKRHQSTPINAGVNTICVRPVVWCHHQSPPYQSGRPNAYCTNTGCHIFRINAGLLLEDMR